MSNPYPFLLKNFLILALLLHPIAHADSKEQAVEESALHFRIAQLQSQVQNNNDKIAALEAALDTANQDIGTLQNEVTLKLNKISAETSKAKIYRTANGHGR